MRKVGYGGGWVFGVLPTQKNGLFRLDDEPDAVAGSVLVVANKLGGNSSLGGSSPSN